MTAKRLPLLLCLLLLALPTASRPASPDAPPLLAPLRITVFPRTQKVTYGYQFAVTMRVTNVSLVPQTVIVMSCSWPDNWTVRATRPAEHARIGLGDSIACAANAPVTTTLPPGGFLEQHTRLQATANGEQAPHTMHYRIGFATKPDAFFSLPHSPAAPPIPIYWSDEAVITVTK